MHHSVLYYSVPTRRLSNDMVLSPSGTTLFGHRQHLWCFRKTKDEESQSTAPGARVGQPQSIVGSIRVDLGFTFYNQFKLGHIEIDIAFLLSFLLLMLLDERRDFGNIRSHYFGYFLTVLEEFKRGHGLDAFRRRHILGLVDVHLGKSHVGGFVRHFFEFGCNKLARAACCCGIRQSNE
jgi:hypothetical protein